MASLGTSTTGAAAEGGEIDLRRVVDRDRRPTLALLLTGEPRAHDPAVDEFLGFAEAQRLDLAELWGAFDAGRPRAAGLLVPGAGRTGMVFCSPVRHRGQRELTASLLRALVAAQDPARLRLLQCLLDPHQHRESEALQDAGFTALAHLVYMQRGTERLGSQVASENFGPGLTVQHWTEARRSLFEQAILRSYEDTLDCPKLLGIRDIDDVVAGHMATGRFDPSMWFVLLEGDEPAAVMLLNELPGRSAVELVYLGLSRPWRGRGLARRLVDHGVDLSARRGLGAMLLAVDEKNTPAQRLYRSAGFRPTARKHAVIHTL